MTPAVLNEVVAGRAPGVLPISVDQLHRMLSLGILLEGDPVELIEGVLVRKNRSDAGQGENVHGPRHAYAVSCLARLDRRLEPLGAHIRTQLPVTLSNVSEPEPDGAIVRGAPRDFASAHPTPEQVLVVFEVADSSLEYDRTTKQRLFAAAGIATYVIVNVQAECLEVFEEPNGNQYARTATLERGSKLALSGLIEISVNELLPAVS
ncbi:MAG: Uma2 family endonuclease [Myxococcaceae bacterium]|nr:Uma2 family endonuclease [Myxococcaceae bacterium]